MSIFGDCIPQGKGCKILPLLVFVRGFLLILRAKLTLLSVITTLTLLGPEMSWAQRPIMPGGYRLPEYLQPITLKPVFRPEPLLQAARQVMGEVASVVPGEKVLILSDSSISPLLPQVFEQAAREKKAQVRVHSIPLSAASDTATLLR